LTKNVGQVYLSEISHNFEGGTMTYPSDFTLPTELLEQISEQGLEYLPELIRILVNTAMQAERQKHLGVEQST